MSIGMVIVGDKIINCMDKATRETVLKLVTIGKGGVGRPCHFVFYMLME